MPWAYVSGEHPFRRRGGRAHPSRARRRSDALILAVVLRAVGAGVPHSFHRHERHRPSIGAWNAPAESGFVTAGALALFAAHAGAAASPRSRWSPGCWPAPARWCSASRTSTTSTSPPARWWPGSRSQRLSGRGLPAPDLWPPHRSGIALGLPRAPWPPRLRSGGMMGSFVVLLHLPRVIGAPDQHVEWIMLAMSSALAGAALLVRKYATMEA